jgi:hypothetical protein
MAIVLFQSHKFTDGYVGTADHRDIQYKMTSSDTISIPNFTTLEKLVSTVLMFEVVWGKEG